MIEAGNSEKPLVKLSYEESSYIWANAFGEDTFVPDLYMPQEHLTRLITEHEEKELRRQL